MTDIFRILCHHMAAALNNLRDGFNNINGGRNFLQLNKNQTELIFLAFSTEGRDATLCSITLKTTDTFM